MDTVLSIREDPVRKDRSWTFIEPESLLWYFPGFSAGSHPVFHVHLTSSQTSSVNTTWTIIFMLMIAKFICLSSQVLLANRLHLNCALSHAFTMLTIGCQPISCCSITTKLSSLFCTSVIDHNPRYNLFLFAQMWSTHRTQQRTSVRGSTLSCLWTNK